MKGGQGFEQGAGADDGADELSSIPRCDYRLGKVERAAQDCLTICLETSGNRDFGVAFGQVDGIGEGVLELFESDMDGRQERPFAGRNTFSVKPQHLGEGSVNHTGFSGD